MFKSVDSVVEWAATIKCTMILDGPSIHGMYGARRSTMNELLMGLSPQEAHEQAEMIIRHIDDLSDPACSQYLLARNHLTDKINNVMDRVFARLLYSGGIHNRDVRKVVLRYMGADIGKREIRESLHCDRNKVDHFITKVDEIMDAIHYQAINDLEERFVNSGLIERRQLATG